METRIPKKAKKEHKKWMNKEILELMEERRKSKSDQVKYKMLNKEVKKKCNEAKEKWINEQFQEIEQNQHLDSKYRIPSISSAISNKRPPLSHPSNT